MPDNVFRAFLSMRMCDDPTCLSDESNAAVEQWLDYESSKRGYATWAVPTKPKNSTPSTSYLYGAKRQSRTRWQ